MNLEERTVRVDDDGSAEGEDHPGNDAGPCADLVSRRSGLHLDAKKTRPGWIGGGRTDGEGLQPYVDRPEPIGRVLGVANRRAASLGVASGLLPPGDTKPFERRRQERDQTVETGQLLLRLFRDHRNRSERVTGRRRDELRMRLPE